MLILPATFYDKRKSDLETLKKRFQKEFEAFVEAHQSHKDPYFVLIKSNPDRKNVNISKQALTFYRKRPPFITRTMVFYVDNSRGLATWLWRVTPERKIIFNTAFAEKYKDVLEAPPA